MTIEAAARPKAILLSGPTASGKTDVAIHLAAHYPLEIVSVDSALVYRDMNIGTAKPTADILAAHPHHLIDLISPEETYSAARFCDDALNAMAAINARGNTPLLVGGTMLYMKALTEGLSAMPAANGEVRARLAARAADIGWPGMHAALQRIDPVTAQRLKPNDAQRIQRAWEVYELSGSPISLLQNRLSTANDFPYQTLKIGLEVSIRSVLHQRIAERFAAMLANGLVEEVRGLQERYRLHAELPSMRCVGYRQTWQFLEGELTATALEEHGIAATRQLAKRQLTWQRSMQNIAMEDCLAADLKTRVTSRVVAFLDAP